VSLRSSDPLDPPRIDPRYLSGAGDRELLALAAEKARAIVAAPAFAPYRGEGSSQAGAPGDIEEHTVSLNHAAGACCMGVTEDCVTDPSLRVRGVEGLRVADASIMPILPRAHPNATVMVIAEQAARLMRQG
jgi:choline dehydrogenase-like flavoprotein